MSALFWLVVRWIAAALVGVAVGSAANLLGLGSVTLLLGAAALLVGGVFVLASILANNTSLLSGSGSADPDAGLVGPGLRRATFLGFLGAGLIVGSVNGNEATVLIAAVTGAIAILLSLGAGVAEQRRLW